MIRSFISTVSLLILLLILTACTPQSTDIFTKIQNLQDRGEFTSVENLINEYTTSQPNLDAETKEKLSFEIERGRRIMNDYRLTEDRLIELLNARLVDFSQPEFDQWQQESRFDMLFVNGEKRFVNASVSNLFFRYPELKKRQKNYSTESSLARIISEHVKKLKALSTETPDPVLFPRLCQVKQTINLKESTVPAGQTVHCWLPYPSYFQTQGEVRFIESNHTPFFISPPEAPIRSIYFEAEAPQNGRLLFDLKYYYTAYSYYQKIDANSVISFDSDDEIYRQYTIEEKPHEVFSPEMRKLAAEIVGDETNPYLKGKRIYDWIAKNIVYSYAREYSTLRNISQYCNSNKYGDCGQEAILFITLCRIAGVPARWQSGFMTFPGDVGMHDWAEIYIKPFGWLPVDPYMGIFFTSMTEDLTREKRAELCDFYYGNIDHFRLVANKGHNLSLYPPKKHFRSETVDFQRGEVEWSGGNLYFTDWNWSIEVSDVEPSGRIARN